MRPYGCSWRANDSRNGRIFIFFGKKKKNRKKTDILGMMSKKREETSTKPTEGKNTTAVKTQETLVTNN